MSLAVTLTTAMPRTQAGTPSEKPYSKQQKLEQVSQPTSKETKTETVDTAQDVKPATKTMEGAKVETTDINSAAKKSDKTPKAGAEDMPAAVNTSVDKTSIEKESKAGAESMPAAVNTSVGEESKKVIK